MKPTSWNPAWVLVVLSAVFAMASAIAGAVTSPNTPSCAVLGVFAGVYLIGAAFASMDR